MDSITNILESSLSCCMKCKGLFKVSVEDKDKHLMTCSGNPFKSPTTYFACERKIFLQLFQPEDFQLDGSFNLLNISKDDSFLNQVIKVRLPQDTVDPLLFLRSYTTGGSGTLHDSGLDLLDQNIPVLDAAVVDKDESFVSEEKVPYHSDVGDEYPIENILSKNLDYLKSGGISDLHAISGVRTCANSLDPDQAPRNVGPDLRSKLFTANYSGDKEHFTPSPSGSRLLSPIDTHLDFLTDGSKSRLQSPYDKGENFLQETSVGYRNDSLNYATNPSFACTLSTDLIEDLGSPQGVNRSSLSGINEPCSTLPDIDLPKKDPFLGQNPGLAQLNSKDPFLINATVRADKPSGPGQKYTMSAVQAKSYFDMQTSPTFQLQDGNYFNFPSTLDEPTQLDYLDLATIDFLTNPIFCYGPKEKNANEKDENITYDCVSGLDQNSTNLSLDSFERYDKNTPLPTETVDDSAVHRKMKNLRLKKVKNRMPKKTKSCMYIGKGSVGSKSAENSPRARRNSAKETEKAVNKIMQSRYRNIGQSNEYPETITESRKSSRKRKLSLPSSFEAGPLDGQAKLKSERKSLVRNRLCESGEIFNVKNKLTGFSEEEKETFKAVLGKNTCVLVKKQKLMPYFKPPVIEYVNNVIGTEHGISDGFVSNTTVSVGHSAISNKTEAVFSESATLVERTSDLVIRCPTCSFTCASVQELSGHTCGQTLTHDQEFREQNCSQTLITSPRKHLNMFTCFQCEFTCESITLLADHVRLHDISKDKEVNQCYEKEAEIFVNCQDTVEVPTCANSLDSDQAPKDMGPDLRSKLFANARAESFVNCEDSSKVCMATGEITVDTGAVVNAFQDGLKETYFTAVAADHPLKSPDAQHCFDHPVVDTCFVKYETLLNDGTEDKVSVVTGSIDTNVCVDKAVQPPVAIDRENMTISSNDVIDKLDLDQDCPSLSDTCVETIATGPIYNCPKNGNKNIQEHFVCMGKTEIIKSISETCCNNTDGEGIKQSENLDDLNDAASEITETETAILKPVFVNYPIPQLGKLDNKKFTVELCVNNVSSSERFSDRDQFKKSLSTIIDGNMIIGNVQNSYQSENYGETSSVVIDVPDTNVIQVGSAETVAFWNIEVENNHDDDETLTGKQTDTKTAGHTDTCPGDVIQTDEIAKVTEEATVIVTDSDIASCDNTDDMMEGVDDKNVEKAPEICKPMDVESVVEASNNNSLEENRNNVSVVDDDKYNTVDNRSDETAKKDTLTDPEICEPEEEIGINGVETRDEIEYSNASVGCDKDTIVDNGSYNTAENGTPTDPEIYEPAETGIHSVETQDEIECPNEALSDQPVDTCIDKDTENDVDVFLKWKTDGALSDHLVENDTITDTGVDGATTSNTVDDSTTVGQAQECDTRIVTTDINLEDHSYCGTMVTDDTKKEEIKPQDSTSTNASNDKGPKTQTKGMIKCDHCSFEGDNRSSVRRHKEKHHGEYWYCTVPECEFKTIYKRNLALHKMKHDGVKRFLCDKCPYTTSDATCFSSHQKHNHTHAVKFKCTDCDFTSMLRVEILRHYRNKHLRQKIYACNQCDYQTGYTYLLKFHLMSHAGIKPFKCSLCEYQVCDSAKVSRHIKTVHIGQPEAKCVKLDLTFEIDAKQFKCAEPMSEKDIKVIELTDEQIKIIGERKRKETLVKKEEKERKEKERLKRLSTCNKKDLKTGPVKMVSLLGNIC